jgi:hypothetical protein
MAQTPPLVVRETLANRIFPDGQARTALSTLFRRTAIVTSMVMPTSVHLPEPLLKAVDRKARSLRISRNQLVVRALEREVRALSDWSPGFFELLTEPTPEIGEAVDSLVRDVRKARRSKRAIKS